MSIILESLQDALPLIEMGQQPWEYETSDRAVKILGPGCGFGEFYLKRCKDEGRYAQTIEEANSIAQKKGVTITGVWLSKK
ncbi:MAG TPA: hypothetical protein VFC63_05095 [Blastocatellia bacterium]|nr:hypothetical protein [Blastocatellia bacterium]